MKIESLVVGEFQVNCYVVHGADRQALVIDPGADAARIVSFLRKRQLSVAAYLLTHGHVDHVSALADLHAALPAPVAMHSNDLKWAFSELNHMLPFYSAPRKPADLSRPLEDRQMWTDAGLTYSVLATPGHTPGSVCFYFPTEGAIFTGDTLFAGSVGRTDLPGGNARNLTDSLRKIKALPDTTMVYPGHGPDTDLGEEKQSNYFMRDPEPRGA